MPEPNDPSDSLQLDEAMTVELCNSLADYGEAGGLSQELMLKVGRYAESRFADSPQTLVAVARMYLYADEPKRARVLLLRVGKLDPDEARVKPLLVRALQQLGDWRTAEQALIEAPSLPPLPSSPPRLPSTKPPPAAPQVDALLDDESAGERSSGWRLPNARSPQFARRDSLAEIDDLARPTLPGELDAFGMLIPIAPRPAPPVDPEPGAMPPASPAETEAEAADAWSALVAPDSSVRSRIPPLPAEPPPEAADASPPPAVESAPTEEQPPESAPEEPPSPPVEVPMPAAPQLAPGARAVRPTIGALLVLLIVALATAPMWLPRLLR